MRRSVAAAGLVVLIAFGLAPRVGPFRGLRPAVRLEAQAVEVASHLIWFDRAGKRLGLVDSPANERGLELSPDAKRATVSMLTAARRTRDIWIVDIASGARTRFTDDTGDKLFSIWSPDGSRVVFDRDQGNGSGARDLVQKPSNGGPETVLYSDPRPKWPLSFSADGRFLAFVTVNPRTGQDVEVLPLTGTERKPMSFQAVPGIKSYPRFSPDGRWIAFGSDEAGPNEIYVAPFPGPGRKIQVSTEGGSWPRWRRDGKELFYVAGDLTIMAVAVNAQGPVLEVGPPKPLFQIEPVVGGFYSYDLSADGQRVLVNTVASAPTSSPRSTIALNWLLGPGRWGQNGRLERVLP
jgi:Tol biopolymer transport system component